VRIYCISFLIFLSYSKGEKGGRALGVGSEDCQRFNVGDTYKNL